MSSITIPCVVFLSCLCPQFFQTSAPLSSCCCAFCICAQTVLVFCLSVSARYSPLAVFDHIDRCSLLSVSILFLVFSCSIFSQKQLFFFQFPSSPTMHASHPYSRILKTHVCSTLFLVSISIDLLFQTFSMAFSATVAFASLVRTSLMLSRSYVVLLPRHVNCSTFSKFLPSINNFPAGSFSPNTIVFVFSKFMMLRPNSDHWNMRTLIRPIP